MRNLVTSLNEIPILEWYVTWHGSKNGYQKDTCLSKKKPRLYIQEYDNHFRLNSQHIGGGGEEDLHDHLIMSN